MPDQRTDLGDPALNPEPAPEPAPEVITSTTSRRARPRNAAAATPPELVGPVLTLSADIVDDLEKVRIANENRLRQLTRVGFDADGLERGFGLPVDHPDVARVAALVARLVEGEGDAVANLQLVYRSHPLYTWSKGMRGVGDKQIARLLAVVGDPFVRPELTRADGSVEPRRVRALPELWAYAGYHVFVTDNGAGVAAHRKRGVKSNWNTVAKTRAWLVASTCVKQLAKPCARPLDAEGNYTQPWADHTPECRCGKYRRLYDETRQHYHGALHAAECARCGPSGKPAQVGSPLSDAHLMARGVRAVAKELLADMWAESRRLHLEAGTAKAGPDGALVLVDRAAPAEGAGG